MSVSNFNTAEDFSSRLQTIKNKTSNQLVNDKLELVEKKTGLLMGFLKVIFLPLTSINFGSFSHYRVDNVAKSIVKEAEIHLDQLNT